MKKRIFALFGFISIICLALFLLWVTNNNRNEKKLNEELSVRFDETMTQTFPFLKLLPGLYIIKLIYWSKMLPTPINIIRMTT